MEKNHDEISYAVRERLQFIELQLLFKGWVSRFDLMAQFGVAEAAATRDFKKYKEISGDNMVLNHTYKRYEINANEFTPIFDRELDAYLVETKAVKNNFGRSEPLIESMENISGTNSKIFFELSRAITNNDAVKIKYRSLENGISEREIVPHAFFDTDLRMYVRCFDRKRSIFINLLVNRVVSVDSCKNQPLDDEMSFNDYSWNSFVELELIPHPNKWNVKNKECVEMDLSMTDGVKVVRVRCATGAFWLNRWNVDCSSNASLSSKKYQLYLKNRSVLESLDSAFIVNGFDD